MQIILYCITYSYITIINMHTQALYWSCIELIKYVYINHDGKAPKPYWWSRAHTDSNYFDLSKVIIKISLAIDKSIASVYLYCFWILRVWLPTLHTLSRHVLAVSFYSQLCPFPRQTNWIFNPTCNLGHNHIILPVLHCHTISNLHHVIIVMRL